LGANGTPSSSSRRLARESSAKAYVTRISADPLKFRQQTGIFCPS
jgi:hypothetical protein